MKTGDFLRHTAFWGILPLLILALSLTSCSSVKQIFGFGGDEDQKDKAEVIDRPDPKEYILVKNPRYTPAGGGPSASGGEEPEFIWVRRRDVPFTADATIRGKRAAEASPQDEARFASTRPAEAPRSPRPDERFFLPPERLKQSPGKGQAEEPREVARRPDPSTLLRPAYGYVVHVKGKQVYTDLTQENGVTVGRTVIIYREGEELKHPVTGAPLGRADEEVARARILEVGEKTSIAEVTSLKDGEEIRPKDKVKILPTGGTPPTPGG